jgi:hypothetical protein
VRASLIVVVGRAPRTPFSAALGLAFFGVHTGWIAVAGGDPRTPFSLLSAWPLRLAFCERQTKAGFALIRRQFYAMSSQRRGCCHGARAWQ